MASRYFINVGVNFNSAANWSATSGGPGGASVPIAGDDIFFDANSGNCTVNTTVISIANVNFTGYNNTITLSVPLYMNGNLTLSPTMTIAGSSRIHIFLPVTRTITSNGKTFTGNLTIEGSGGNSVILADNFTITGLFSPTNAGISIGGNFNINCYGGITSSSLTQLAGTSTILNLYGGTWSGQIGGAGGGLAVNILGDISLGASCTVYFCTLNYVSGVVTTTGSILNILASTINTSGMIWNNVTFLGGFNSTLTSDLNINGTLTLGNVGGGIGINGSGFRVNVRGNISQVDSSITSGSATLVFTGNGTWTNTSSGVLRMNTIINTTGILTTSGTVRYNTGTLTYTSGRVVCLAGSTLNIDTGTYINMDKINFRTVNINPASTITMNRFFSGSAVIPTRIQSSTPGSNYTISFQDGFEKITKFTKISNCTVSRRNQLLCITDKSNKGGNVGIRYINQSPNSIPQNKPTSPNPMTYGAPTFLEADPNFTI